MSVGGNDVSAAFKSDAKGGWVGLVTGLKDGSNALAVKAGGNEASLTLVNHPVNGTLFAGPQQAPFVCENELHGLDSAKDASCAAPTHGQIFLSRPRRRLEALQSDARRARTTSATTKTSEGRRSR